MMVWVWLWRLQSTRGLCGGALDRGPEAGATSPEQDLGRAPGRHCRGHGRGRGRRALAGCPSVWPLVLASALLGIVEQAGDLMNRASSAISASDSGHLIPGHGGFSTGSMGWP